jgi:putative component of membrane protein insertase Oxa1/YidC/SpoIIIJ protein YidD
MTFASNLAIRSILLYQNHISPRKGFRCAFSVFHNDLSCSAFCKNEFATNGVIKGIVSTLKRFQSCRHDALSIKGKSNFRKNKEKNSFSVIEDEDSEKNENSARDNLGMLADVASCCALFDIF